MLTLKGQMSLFCNVYLVRAITSSLYIHDVSSAVARNFERGANKIGKGSGGRLKSPVGPGQGPGRDLLCPLKAL